MRQGEKRMMKMGVAAISAVMILALPAMADARGTGQGRAMLPDFGTLDQSGSGSVTLEEFQERLDAAPFPGTEAMITRLMQEVDAEGKLDEAALRAGLEADAAERRGARQTEMRTRLFARIDANSDGEISAEEYEAFTSRMSERMERRGSRDPGAYRWR
ncbi:MAG: hypothetical protein EA339_05390 [Rhodobacteraceae bacterium]|nr:MAG: hypothetical protein EA339_05390 [Paracoccaceae bacterium]